METSRHGLECLKGWEGCILHVYKDAGGLPTIGIGHLLTKEERTNGKYDGGITEEQSLDILANDLKRFEKCVNSSVKVKLNQNQFDALVIFAFNIGDGGFLASTALRMLNDKQFDKVPDAMRMWNKVGGRVNQGLIERREKEIRLFLEVI